MVDDWLDPLEAAFQRLEQEVCRRDCSHRWPEIKRMQEPRLGLCELCGGHRILNVRSAERYV